MLHIKFLGNIMVFTFTLEKLIPSGVTYPQLHELKKKTK